MQISFKNKAFRSDVAKASGRASLRSPSETGAWQRSPRRLLTHIKILKVLELLITAAIKAPSFPKSPRSQSSQLRKPYNHPVIPIGSPATAAIVDSTVPGGDGRALPPHCHASD